MHDTKKTSPPNMPARQPCDYCTREAKVYISFGEDCELWEITDHHDGFACLPCASSIFIGQEHLDELKEVLWVLLF